MKAWLLILYLANGDIVEGERPYTEVECRELAATTYAILVTSVDHQPVEPFEVQVDHAECEPVPAPSNRKITA